MHLFQCVESLEKYFFFVSIAKYSDRCFCYFTAAMFVSLQTAQTWRLHTKKFYKYGWHTSANNARMKNSRDLIPGEIVCISIIYRIPDSRLYSLNGYDVQFWSHDWWKLRGKSRSGTSCLYWTRETFEILRAYYFNNSFFTLFTSAFFHCLQSL